MYNFTKRQREIHMTKIWIPLLMVNDFKEGSYDLKIDSHLRFSTFLRFQSHRKKMRFKSCFFISFYSRFIFSIDIKPYL